MQGAGRLSLGKSEKSEDEADKGRVEVQLEDVPVPSVDIYGVVKDISTGPTSTIDEKRLVRKIDFTLIPWLSVLYLLCFLDRIGIGNARLYGMEADLNITDTQYLICLTLFFIPYALLEAPANILLKRLKPSIWISSIMTLWGIVTVAQGLVTNFAGLLAIRILLGVFEAGFFPGSTYYLSCWYKRDELGIRLAIFASSITTAGAFGGLLSAAISNMDGVGGKGAWAWIFILEGIATVFAGVASFFLLQDFPDTARFLSEDERKFVIRRLQSDDMFSAGGEKMRWRNVKKSVMDWKTWLSATLLFGSPIYALSLFLPSIIAMLGYKSTKSNLLSVPVYVVSSITSWIVGYAADRLRKRGYFSIGLSGLAVASFLLLLLSRKAALSYFGTYVAAIGVFSNGANNLAWLSNNVEGSYKRSVSVALVLTWGNLAGIISSNTYRRNDAPWYTRGHAISLGLVTFAHVGAIVLQVLLRRENKLRDLGVRDEVIVGLKSGDPCNGVYDSVDAAKRDKGDEWSGYRYIT